MARHLSSYPGISLNFTSWDSTSHEHLREQRSAQFYADTPNLHVKELCSSSSFQGPFISNMYLFVTSFLYCSWQRAEHDTTGKKSGKSTLDGFPPQTKNVVDMFCFNSTHSCLVISFNKLPSHWSEVSDPTKNIHPADLMMKTVPSSPG